MKVLLDTNILMDLLDGREPYASDVRKLCIASYFGDVQLWVSVQSYADVYYLLCQKRNKQDVKEAMRSTLKFFIPCNTYASELESALLSDWDDIEDFLIANTAKHIKADFFITRDQKLFDVAPVSAMNASAFLSYLYNEHGLEYDSMAI